MEDAWAVDALTGMRLEATHSPADRHQEGRDMRMEVQRGYALC